MAKRTLKHKGGAATSEEIADQRENDIKTAKKHSPSLGKKQKVQIDKRTVMYISADADPEERLQNFLDKYDGRHF